ncbi:hypothetical protein ABKV19_000895, partial [Rosa sericea]
VANIIFIDAPVGTGFSYAKNWDEYPNLNDTISAAQTYQFLRKWLVDHPRFISNPLYITGDSYAGIVLPIIVQKISDGNEDGLAPAMNLQGYVLGNPVTDEVQDANSQVLFAYLKALISHDLYQSTKRNCKGEYVNVDPNNAVCLYDLELVNECVQDLNKANILEPSCTFETPKPIGRKWHPQEFSNKDPIDLLLPSSQVSRPWCREYNYISSRLWANDKTVQSALHVVEGSIKEWVRCNTSLEDSYVNDVSSTVIYHKNLIRKGYRVLIYSGDHDMDIPYVGTFAWIESLNLTIDEISWKPWFVNAQVAGYKTKYTLGKYELTYTTIKGAGHTAPEYKPEACLSMISRWFALYPL